MLVEFSQANLLPKARQQPDKVKQVLDKIKNGRAVAPRSKRFSTGWMNRCRSATAMPELLSGPTSDLRPLTSDWGKLCPEKLFHRGFDYGKTFALGGFAAVVGRSTRWSSTSSVFLPFLDQSRHHARTVFRSRQRTMEEAGVDGLRWTADQAATLQCQHLFLVVGRGKPARRLEPGDRFIAVKNEHGAAVADGIEEGAQVVFRFGNTSYFHMANLARCSVNVSFPLTIGRAL